MIHQKIVIGRIHNPQNIAAVITPKIVVPIPRNIVGEGQFTDPNNHWLSLSATLQDPSSAPALTPTLQEESVSHHPQLKFKEQLKQFSNSGQGQVI